MHSPAMALTFLLGATYPPHTDDHLNDIAGVVRAEHVEGIRSAARRVLRDNGVPIVVATIRSLADQEARDWSVERYATNLYNDWGIGERTSNRGVLLLVAVRDRKLRIVTGDGLRGYDSRARAIIDGTIVPRFKTGDFSGGIAAGVEAIAGWFRPVPERPLAERPPQGLPEERSAGGEGGGWNPHGTGVIRKTEEGGGIGPVFKVILMVIAIGIVLSIFRRRRPVFGGGGAFGGYPGRGGGGWGGFLLGGLAGFLGSRLLSGGSRRSQWGGGHWGAGGGGGLFGGGSGSSGGGSFGGGGGSSGSSSFGGGFSSGGGASGSW